MTFWTMTFIDLCKLLLEKQTPSISIPIAFSFNRAGFSHDHVAIPALNVFTF